MGRLGKGIFAVVPEPSTLVIFATGGISLFIAWRRRRQTA
jgi:hypothetical protein